MPIWRCLCALGLLLLFLSGRAEAAGRTPADLAEALAERYGLSDQAMLVADAANKRPLLCVVAVKDSRDVAVNEQEAALLCQGKVAGWNGNNRWVRIIGLGHRSSTDVNGQTVALYVFGDADGPNDATVSRWLDLALSKLKGDQPIEVGREPAQDKQ